jgi:hypothetical protein
MKKMYPNVKTRANFKYPPGGLMELRDYVRYDELHHPTMVDASGEECLIVVKNGTSTGTRLGRATGIKSFVRKYKDDRIHSTSKEIAVYHYSSRDGAFSAPGDSGSVVTDANHRIVGMLTGGAGQTESTDVTYVTAYESLNECIKKAFPRSHLFLIRGSTPHLKPTRALWMLWSYCSFHSDRSADPGQPTEWNPTTKDRGATRRFPDAA